MMAPQYSTMIMLIFGMLIAGFWYLITALVRCKSEKTKKKTKKSKPIAQDTKPTEPNERDLFIWLYTQYYNAETDEAEKAYKTTDQQMRQLFISQAIAEIPLK